jgi:glycosyltransferase involved in cell wall biosynthesis
MIPGVSVVIPLYNKGHCISRTLDSVLTQTYQNIEIIVIDDGSTDNGPEVVKTFKDPRIILITQENKGPGAARNVGLRRAVGKYIVFLDADDEWARNFLQEGVDFLNNNEEISTISSGYYDTSKGDDEITSFWNRKGVLDGIYELSDDTHPEVAVHLLGYMIPCTTIAKREIINKYGGFFDTYRCLYGEDAHLWFKIILNEKIAISRRKLVTIHREDSDLSSNLPGAHPIPPDLQDPENIEIDCPTDKKNLLMKMLAIRAADEAKHNAYFGLKIEAEQLLNEFCYSYKPNRYFIAKLYIHISFILQHLRKNFYFVSCSRKILRLCSRILEMT